MTKKMEEIILEELFKLSSKIDQMQEEMKNFATKDDLKETEERINQNMDALEERINQNMAALEERINQNMDALEEKINQNMDALEERINQNMNELEERLNNKIKREARDTAQIFKDAFGYAEDEHKKMEERLNQKIDSKFESLPCQIKLKVKANH